MKDNPILVTGAHRSGSSWVGEVICYSHEVEFIWEPFSFNYYPPLVKTRPPCWFLYITEGHPLESVWRDNIETICRFEYGLAHHLRFVRSVRDLAKVLRDWNRFQRKKARKAIPLLKDPISLFSSRWLERQFGAKVVVTVRHPCAFADSLIRPGWMFHWHNLLEQEQLMADYLSQYQDLMERYKADGCDLIDTSILLWNIFYGFVDEQVRQGANWFVIRHEDAVNQPQNKFREIYDWLGLGWTDEVDNRVSTMHKMDTLKWQKNLPQDSIERVLSGTADVRQRFYQD